MSDLNRKPDRDDYEEEGYIPSSPTKRVMAWIGVVYMVIVVFLTTYIYATAAPLQNVAPLLSIPALVGFGIMVLVNHRTTGKPRKIPAILLALICFGAALYSLPLGIFGLMSNFGG
jgi:hypothetical protein